MFVQVIGAIAQNRFAQKACATPTSMIIFNLVGAIIKSHAKGTVAHTPAEVIALSIYTAVLDERIPCDEPLTAIELELATYAARLYGD